MTLVQFRNLFHFVFAVGDVPVTRTHWSKPRLTDSCIGIVVVDFFLSSADVFLGVFQLRQELKYSTMAFNNLGFDTPFHIVDRFPPTPPEKAG